MARKRGPRSGFEPLKTERSERSDWGLGSFDGRRHNADARRPGSTARSHLFGFGIHAFPTVGRGNRPQRPLPLQASLVALRGWPRCRATKMSRAGRLRPRESPTHRSRQAQHCAGSLHACAAGRLDLDCALKAALPSLRRAEADGSCGRRSQLRKESASGKPSGRFLSPTLPGSQKRPPQRRNRSIGRSSPAKNVTALKLRYLAGVPLATARAGVAY
mmetsp:Transcript_41592/g.89874  ORF Transcript_41592/g.89874 Transcript_41592/m.89874 type:complete len:217 (+) Transcript_41592:407-1057(+)